MIFYDGYETHEYAKTCRDFGYTGVECCRTCHDEPEYEMEVVVVDAVPCLLCCKLRAFFYPRKDDPKMTAEEKLLRSIFGERPHDEENN
jgi:hypothetical protein